MEADAETVFNYLGKRYEDAFLDSPKLCQVVRRTISALEPHSRVLDVGCGTGKPVADIVASAGHEVYGIDISETMVNIAHSQVRGTFQKADMRQYTPPCAMDAVFAVYSLFQISPSDTHSMVFKFAEWLREGGLLVLGVTPSTSLRSDQGTFDPVWGCIREVIKPWMTWVTKETFLSEQGWLDLLRQAGFSIEAERLFQFLPNDAEHKTAEAHYLLVARKTTSTPLLGPYPLPQEHAVLPLLHEKTWASLQRQLVIEGGQTPVLGHMAGAQSLLELGCGLSSFMKASEMSFDGATQSLPALLERLPFADGQFNATFSTFALDSVPNLRSALSELARITDPSSPAASITIVQGAPDNEVIRLLNSVCLPRSTQTPQPSHQGYLLHYAKKVLSMEGFGNISLHRVRSKYVFAEHDTVNHVADLVAGSRYREDNKLEEMKKALAPHLLNLFSEHPDTLRNDLVMLIARPTPN
ncbi:S-adenosyl-L-methionine-dependent methyltransferase [Aspergillus steynii IBT 23096]|uniref:S-adenosyl-L-methionine-dependent methyltransferase n=1 Tax=Aspergillus steynii IBT 23096 TaxID=1392250 RepID=A0A2I2GHF5_9EURO|nr:S-adenosyl-L-methionine-dependent methyltransferase [Aspergillus steynii IBT 23096]PLB52304.1 S-adenosyl-L-methionine-dependent methyltransferase [Aspergillus steynii IBT 23096]